MVKKAVQDAERLFAACAFRFPWRPYQERILREFEHHAKDGRIHVVAAPGSGKTVLGLEAVRRTGKPALILAPSIAIRDQWIQRFLEHFLRTNSRPEWISDRFDEPGVLTATTYQALASAVKREDVETVARRLKRAGVGVFVFDEAHHLRREWWKALYAVKEEFKRACTVSLTATPPYDVSAHEWNRYIALCGEVDAEVSVPELVRENNLCPHQDFVYFGMPSEEEEEKLRKYAAGVASFLRDLCLDVEFQEMLLSHPAVLHPGNHSKSIALRNDYFLSIAIFLNHANGTVPRKFLRSMGLKRVVLPPFHVGWAEVLLEGVLFHDRESYGDHEEKAESVARQLRRLGALERRGVHLRENPRLVKRLRSSRSKLDSIAAITELESRTLRHRLRLLILTDYIREKVWVAGEAFEARARVGVVPIFEHLRRLRLPDVSLGIATGRLTVIPASAAPFLAEAALRCGLDPSLITTRPLEHDAAYLRVEARGLTPSELLPLMTGLFSQGEVNVLVGTAALLGEGWDAPKINALILATVVGSFMQSNQMRGRAIRVDPEDEFKTANIWHLACLNPATRDALGISEEKEGPAATPYVAATATGLPQQEGREDLELLERRFRCFAGLDFEKPLIRDGLERLGIWPHRASLKSLLGQNARMCEASGERDVLAERWTKALNLSGEQGRLAGEVLIPPDVIRSRSILEGLLYRGGGVWGNLLNWLLARRARHAARGLADAFVDAGLIERSSRRPKVEVVDGADALHVRLRGVEGREEALFCQSLQEIFDPLWSPRYLIVSGRNTWCVPKVLGVNRELADLFGKHWHSGVRGPRVVYTGNEDGRRLLTHAKQRYLASLHRDVPESRSVWT